LILTVVLAISVALVGPALPSQAEATGSVYFPNSSYGTMSPGISFGGVNDPFTIEAWFKTEYSHGGESIVIIGAGSNKGLSLLSVPGGGYSEWKLDSQAWSAVIFQFAQTPSLNEWHYIAATRDSSGYMQIWLDGVASSSGRTNSSNANTPDFTGSTSQIGAWTGNTRYNQGTYISNLRATNTNMFDTTASTLSIPTAPFGAVSGTKLLMNTATLIDSSGTQTSIVSSGSPVLSSQNPFFGAATITGISPVSGPSQGGTPVTITGTNLANATVSVGGAAATIVSTSATTIEILTPAGTVGAQNVVVTGAAGTPTTTYTYQLVNLPGAPTSVNATSGGTLSSVVSWSAPASTGGSALTEYQVLSSGGQTCTSTTTACTVLGLEAGTAYTFTVRAKNVLGYGVYSAASASATTAATATQATTTSTPTPAPTAVLAITGVQWPFALVLGISSLVLIGLGATMFGYRRANRRFSNY
jgi:hypothetical protein